MNSSRFSFLALTVVLLPTACATMRAESGFTSLFDGKTLAGWTLAGDGAYLVKDGVLICPEGTGGKLFSDKEYADFVLRLDFKLQPGGNNGVGIRCPLGAPGEQMAYSGM